MTSGNFRSFPLSSIIANHGDRQRGLNSNHVDELAESLNRTGLINPIVITSEGVLVAGAHRLAAAQQLGWTNISVQFVEDLSDYDLQIIELEENLKRKDLTWQEECLALERFHGLKCSYEDDWTQAQTAAAVGIADSFVTRQLAVAKALNEGNENVLKAEKLSVAINLVARANERKKTSTLNSVDALFKAKTEVSKEVSETNSEEFSNQKRIVERVPPILLADFHEWQADYAGPKFNLIHCDFPYGINVASGPRQNSSITETYDDSPEVYWALMGTLLKGMENVVAESAHLIFWFSMHHYSRTLESLGNMGWTVDPFPLIWHKSDNSGVAPDPQRKPRRTYETAFFATRGDRKLTERGTRSASFSFPGKIGDEAHMSAKPQPMLEHFLSMVCDEYSTFLDPTCGGASALKAAEALGAHSVLGLEKNEDFFTTATMRYYGEE